MPNVTTPSSDTHSEDASRSQPLPDMPEEARSRLLNKNELPIWSSDKQYAWDDSVFPPDTTKDIYTIEQYRKTLPKTISGLSVVTVINKTLDITNAHKGANSLEGQELTTCEWFDPKGNAMFEQTELRNRFCVCKLTSAAQNKSAEKEDGKKIYGFKDAKLLLDVLEYLVEGGAFLFYGPEVRICPKCGMAKLMVDTNTRELRSIYPVHGEEAS